MKELIGRKISSLWINNDQSVLVFGTDSGVVGYETDSECCSKTWFADILGVGAMLGGTVACVEEVSMGGYNVNNGRCRDGYDKVYGYKLFTDKGCATIVFRNSSNGCYGGWITLLRGGMPQGLSSITEDWQA